MSKPLFLVATALLATAACHTRRENMTYRARFNPPVGSTYHYEMTSETNLTVKGDDKDVDLHRKSDMAVSCAISKDSDQTVLEMTFDKIHIQIKNGDSVTNVDAADAPIASDPMRQLLTALKTDTIFARVRPSDFTMGFSGGTEVVGPIVEQEYAEADKGKARTYWQQWVEQEIIWKNLDPLTWSLPRSGQTAGDHWTTLSTNREDINFTLDNSFQLESIDSGIARIRSAGRVKNEVGGTWLMGDRVTGDLSGKEEGVWFVDTATGMLVRAESSVNIEETVEIRGQQAGIKFETTIKMKGKKVN